MAGRWFRFDADFFDHHKALAVSLAARGLFVASIGYCWRHETDGWVPRAAIRRLVDDDTVDEVELADELVRAGLWEQAGANFRVHDYLDHQPSSEQRAADRKGARDRQRKHRHGDVTRDTENMSQTDASDDAPPPRTKRRSQHDPASGETEPDSSSAPNVVHKSQVKGLVDSHADVTRDSSDDDNMSQRKKTVEDGRRRDRTGEHSPPEEGSGEKPPPDVGTQAADATPTPPSDAERNAKQLCDLLADSIEAWAGERPPVGKRWHDAARLLLTKDGYTVEQVTQLISFATSSEFWRSNILSMPKLREKRLTLLGQLQRARASPNGVAAPVTAADRHAATRAQTSADLDAWAAQAEAQAEARGGDRPP